MSVLDKFLDAIRLNDDYDDEDEFFDDDIEEDFEDEKPKKRFFRTLDDDDDLEDDFVKPKKKTTVSHHETKTASPSSTQSMPKQSRSVQPKSSAKVTPMRKKQGGSGMEVCVIKPNSMEDTREIADTLLANCTVVLNVEGIDVKVAQRIIDFSSGSWKRWFPPAPGPESWVFPPRTEFPAQSPGFPYCHVRWAQRQ